MARFEYDASPSSVERPIGTEELSTLRSDGGKLLMRGRNLAHFLDRVENTIRIYKERSQNLQNQMQTLASQAEQGSRISGADPRDMLRFIAPAILAQHMGGQVMEQWGAADRAAQAAEKQRREIVSTAHGLGFAISGILEDHSIPASLREHLKKVMDGAKADFDKNQVAIQPAFPPPASFETAVPEAPPRAEDDVIAALEPEVPMQVAVSALKGNDTTSDEDELDDLFGGAS